jgi:hypothetical protein
LKLLCPGGMGYMSGRRLLASITCALSFSVLCLPAAWAQTNFAPGVVDHRPSTSERTIGNHVKSASACQALNGQWYEEKGSDALCVLPYPDAGKVCKNSKECIGHCIAPFTSAAVLHGTCQRNDSPYDCGRPHFENGKIIYFNCD